ncbi:anthranilate 1,2-dioxygenase ferredoxin subunit AndAb [Solimonas marina]|uniref:Non-heme iron oxygenase ferredoxin subunit n=1 Tax=Solimonas marina TaxID=2714601 RepID=A0A969WAL5_9GAMM|nr:anthranilate 1,2-dioxygenase ferredoxin subunit AndAb [Solimonas marina]NKF22624.1 non-heme iron oxygenase ferredoxin subunit [Solimonas marina]
MTTWHDVGAEADFEDGCPAAVEAGGKPVAIFRVEHELFALHDLCTHGAARLSDGFVEDGCVECPLHQGLFDLRTGAVRSAPLTEAVRSYPVRITDTGRVEVGVT